MKFFIQSNDVESYEKSVKVDPIINFSFDDTDQVFCYDEADFINARGFLLFSGLPGKFVIPSKEIYTYPGLFAETDANILINYIDFVKQINFVEDMSIAEEE